MRYHCCTCKTVCTMHIAQHYQRISNKKKWFSSSYLPGFSISCVIYAYRYTCLLICRRKRHSLYPTDFCYSGKSENNKRRSNYNVRSSILDLYSDNNYSIIPDYMAYPINVTFDLFCAIESSPNKKPICFVNYFPWSQWHRTYAREERYMLILLKCLVNKLSCELFVC